MIIKQHAHGMFCWADLSTSDAGAAKRFYGELFGWQFEDMPMGEAGPYTMCKVQGEHVGALYKTSADEAKQGIPPHWNAYIAVTNADEIAKTAQAIGGKVLAPPFEVMNVGRMTVIQDPSGAVFCAWQSKGHHGYGRVNEPGAVCWNELMTRDVDGARKFYTKLFDYGVQSQEFGPMKYTVYMMGDRPVGGMMAIEKGMEQVPPHWLVYFQVTNADAIAKKVASSGGKVIVPPMEIPNVGRFAVLLDPQHAAFGIIQPPAK